MVFGCKITKFYPECFVQFVATVCQRTIVYKKPYKSLQFGGLFGSDKIKFYQIL